MGNWCGTACSGCGNNCSSQCCDGTNTGVTGCSTCSGDCGNNCEGSCDSLCEYQSCKGFCNKTCDGEIYDINIDKISDLNFYIRKKIQNEDLILLKNGVNDQLLRRSLSYTFSDYKEKHLIYTEINELISNLKKINSTADLPSEVKEKQKILHDYPNKIKQVIINEHKKEIKLP